MSGEQNTCSTVTFEVLEYSGQRDLDPNQVECFLTSPNETQNDIGIEKGDKLSCQICKLSFEGSNRKHRLLEHVNSIHNFNIFKKGDTCRVCNAVFYTSKAFRIHETTCEINSESSVSITSRMSDDTDKQTDKKNESNSENADSDVTLDSKNCAELTKSTEADSELFYESSELKSENCAALTTRENSTVRKVVPNNSLKCYSCSKVFRRTRDFTSHVITYHKDESTDKEFEDLSYRCKKCSVTFPNLTLLRDHFFKKHTASIIYRCIVCHVTLKNKKSLRIHYNNVHARKSKEPHSCDECGKELANLKAIKAHIRLKHGQNSNKQGFRCRLCQQKFDTKEKRKLHYEEEHLGESPFICTDCGKGFSSKSGLYGHRQLHKTDQPSTCPYCEKIFNRRDSYHEHILIHVGPRHRCPHCPKEFVQRSNLVRHIRIHTGQKPYTCTFCDKRFSDKGACNSHIRVHTKEEQCTCPYCGQTFTKKQKLKYHMRKHTGEGLISCEICSKTFTNAFALKEHRAIHDRQTQTICVECGKAFNSAKYLQRHVALVHQEPQDSSMALHCPICGKTFYHQTRLKSHLVTHLGKKHLQCLICDKRYSSTKSIRNHLKQSHDLRPDQPEFKKSVRSTFENTQISVNSVQLTEHSTSPEISSKDTVVTFLFKKENSAVIESTTTSDQEIDNENSEIKWTSKFHDRRSITSSLDDDDLGSAYKDSGSTVTDTEFVEEICAQNSTKLEQPEEPKSELVSIKSEEISNYDRNYESDCVMSSNLSTANETHKTPHKINYKIVNNLCERSMLAAATDLGQKSSDVDKVSSINQGSGCRQRKSNSSAIIEDHIDPNDVPNRCESQNNSMKELVADFGGVGGLQILGKQSESSRDISRRRKQLRTPKKYVSPIETLGTIENKLKNVTPKKERVEAIARSLKELSNFKEICIEEAN